MPRAHGSVSSWAAGAAPDSVASICRTLASWALILSRRCAAAASSRSASARIRSARATARPRPAPRAVPPRPVRAAALAAGPPRGPARSRPAGWSDALLGLRSWRSATGPCAPGSPARPSGAGSARVCSKSAAALAAFARCSWPTASASSRRAIAWRSASSISCSAARLASSTMRAGVLLGDRARVSRRVALGLQERRGAGGRWARTTCVGRRPRPSCGISRSLLVSELEDLADPFAEVGEVRFGGGWAAALARALRLGFQLRAAARPPARGAGVSFLGVMVAAELGQLGQVVVDLGWGHTRA